MAEYIKKVIDTGEFTQVQYFDPKTGRVHHSDPPIPKNPEKEIRPTTRGRAEKIEAEQKALRQWGEVYNDGEYQVIKNEGGTFTVRDLALDEVVKSNIKSQEDAIALVEERKMIEEIPEHFSRLPKTRMNKVEVDMEVGATELDTDYKYLGGGGVYDVWQTPGGYLQLHHRTLGAMHKPVPATEFEDIASAKKVEYQVPLISHTEKSKMTYMGGLSSEQIEKLEKQKLQEYREKRLAEGLMKKYNIQ